MRILLPVRIAKRLVERVLGFQLNSVVRRFRGLGWYVRNWRRYQKRLYPSSPFGLSLSQFLKTDTLLDRFADAGQVHTEYFVQDVYFAGEVLKAAPNVHWDVGSRVDGFIAHLIVHQPVNVIDIRRLDSPFSRLKFFQGDITSLFLEDGSVNSLSCLHTIEHIGLGRYGDSLDPDGWAKAVAELRRVLAPRGKLYLSVPVGRERLEFDAHRVFNPNTILSACADLHLVRFSVVSVSGTLINAMKTKSGWT